MDRADPRPSAGWFAATVRTHPHNPDGAHPASLDGSEDRAAPGKPGDIALGDRNYAKPGALKSVLDRGADFIVRVGWSSLRVRNADGTALIWETMFGAIAPGCVIERRVQVAHPGARRRRGQTASKPG